MGADCGFSNLFLTVRVPGWGDGEAPYIPREAIRYNLPSFEIDSGTTASRTIPILLHALNNTNAQPYPLVVFEPGADTERTLEVTVSTSSSTGGCARITEMSFDVVGVA